MKQKVKFLYILAELNATFLSPYSINGTQLLEFRIMPVIDNMHIYVGGYNYVG